MPSKHSTTASIPYTPLPPPPPTPPPSLSSLPPLTPATAASASASAAASSSPQPSSSSPLHVPPLPLRPRRRARPDQAQPRPGQHFPEPLPSTSPSTLPSGPEQGPVLHVPQVAQRLGGVPGEGAGVRHDGGREDQRARFVVRGHHARPGRAPGRPRRVLPARGLGEGCGCRSTPDAKVQRDVGDSVR
ncbi:uncharacterized protein J3R85_011974 [Psidium guajava]|nr:uncharacterized protein J3R85_011974 [Psidium guajava]